jgi:hypothetical protein
MKPFSLRIFTPWWMALLSLLLLAGCGSDNNPISPTASSINQVNSANSTVPNNVFSATLTGSEGVPPVNSAATATGIVIVDLNSRQMKATVVSADIDGTQAHIHQAAKGAAGPVVFPLTQTSAGSGVWTASATLTEEQLAALQSGNYYFNVQSAAFPEGEIRGQILAQLPKSGAVISTPSGTGVTASGTSSTNAATATTGTTSDSSGTETATTSGASSTGITASSNANRPVFYTNVLTGAQVVPGTSSTASATGISVYRPLDKSLTAVIVSSGITGTGANIRQAAAGAIGPLVSNLNETAAGSGIWSSRTTLNNTQMRAFNAGSMYYEILSAAFPNGELRGQIVKTQGATQKTSAGTAKTGTTTTPATATTTGTAVTSGTTTPVTTTTGTATTTPVTTTTGTAASTPVTTTTGTAASTPVTTTTGTAASTPVTTTTGTAASTPVTTTTGTAVSTPVTTTTGTTTTTTGAATSVPASPQTGTTTGTGAATTTPPTTTTTTTTKETSAAMTTQAGTTGTTTATNGSSTAGPTPTTTTVTPVTAPTGTGVTGTSTPTVSSAVK